MVVCEQCLVPVGVFMATSAAVETSSYCDSPCEVTSGRLVATDSRLLLTISACQALSQHVDAAAAAPESNLCLIDREL